MYCSTMQDETINEPFIRHTKQKAKCPILAMFYLVFIISSIFGGTLIFLGVYYYSAPDCTIINCVIYPDNNDCYLQAMLNQTIPIQHPLVSIDSWYCERDNLPSIPCFYPSSEYLKQSYNYIYEFGNNATDIIPSTTQCSTNFKVVLSTSFVSCYVYGVFLTLYMFYRFNVQ